MKLNIHVLILVLPQVWITIKKNVQNPFRIGKYLGTLAFYTYRTTNTMIIWNRFVIKCEFLPHIRPFCRYILPF